MFKLLPRYPGVHLLPLNRIAASQSHPLYTSTKARIKRIPIYLASAFGVLSVTTIIGTVTHCNDEYFPFYPFPFAIDIGVGPSMLPTMIPFDTYWRDCWSNRFFWMNWDHFKQVTMQKFASTSVNKQSEGITARMMSYTRPWQKGDIVTIFNPYSKTIVCKRIIGLEGDSVKVFGEYAQTYYELDNASNCGVPCDSRYPTLFCEEEALKQGQKSDATVPIYQTTIVVPPNHVWVEGDNPLHSTDSRHYGPLPLSSLRGRLTLRLWPISRANKDEQSDDNCVLSSLRPTPSMSDGTGGTGECK